MHSQQHLGMFLYLLLDLNHQSVVLFSPIWCTNSVPEVLCWIQVRTWGAFPWLQCLQPLQRLGLWGWAGQTLGSLHQLKVVWHQVWGFHSSTFNPEVPPMIIIDPLRKTLTSIKHAQCKPLPLICEESRVPVVDLPVLMCFSCEYQSSCRVLGCELGQSRVHE